MDKKTKEKINKTKDKTKEKDKKSINDLVTILNQKK